MNWDAIGAVGEIVGAVTVVATLIYLAIQIRQGTNLASAEAQRELMNAFQAHLDRMIENSDVVRRGLNGLDELTDNEKFEFSLIFNQFLNHLEQPLRMFERGLETQDNVDMYGNICLVWLRAPGSWAVWEKTREYYFPLSSAYIEARLRKPESLPPMIIDIYPWAKIMNEDKGSQNQSPPNNTP